MKAKSVKKSGASLRHQPFAEDIEKPTGKLKAQKQEAESEPDDIAYAEEFMTDDVATSVVKAAREQQREFLTDRFNNEGDIFVEHDTGSESDEQQSDTHEVDDDLAFDGDYVDGKDLTAEEEAVVGKFLRTSGNESRNLADIIMRKLEEKQNEIHNSDFSLQKDHCIPEKVIQVYSSVGKILQHYRSGKLPKALKMLPHLRNWEEVLWITRPDLWSPAATYSCTRIFVSNLNDKMAQRFMNMVLLEKCRDDIYRQKKLNYYYYLAIKKALYKPAAFYKGFLLPLAQSGTCTLREAVIFGSSIAKCSIPANHSAAVLLRLAGMPYSGSTSMFIRILLNKKYSLPRRVIDALVMHFGNFQDERRQLPVVWHQSLLVFIQRYKYEFSAVQRQVLLSLIAAQNHYQISPEIMRELKN